MAKSIVITVILLVIVNNCPGQVYNITFAGTGESTILTSVKVENITTSSTVTLSGTDVLRLNVSTGISSDQTGMQGRLLVYPNPARSATVCFIPPVAGMAFIKVSGLSGATLAELKIYLEKEKTLFQISGASQGLFLISVSGSGYCYTEKFIGQGKDEKSAITIDRSYPGIGYMEYETARTTTVSHYNSKSAGIVEMDYRNGEILKYTGISGDYSTIITEIPSGDKILTFNFARCIDADNITYPTVIIGSQRWMAVNLKTTRYSNGDIIGTTTPVSLDISPENDPKYQWIYNDDEKYLTDYGRLYTWFAAADARNICPSGWRVPSDSDFQTLVAHLGGEDIAAGKLKETGTLHWQGPAPVATNESGFTALPGGSRYSNGLFLSITGYGSFWSSTQISSPYAIYYGMVWNNGKIDRHNYFKNWGYSVRCIQN